jgi:AcrR family transcriptional regulator
MAKRPSKSQSSKPGDISKTVIETAMKLAADRGWRELSLVEIAAEAKLPLAEVYPLFRSMPRSWHRNRRTPRKARPASACSMC